MHRQFFAHSPVMAPPPLPLRPPGSHRGSRRLYPRCTSPPHSYTAGCARALFLTPRAERTRGRPTAHPPTPVIAPTAAASRPVRLAPRIAVCARRIPTSPPRSYTSTLHVDVGDARAVLDPRATKAVAQRRTHPPPAWSPLQTCHHQWPVLCAVRHRHHHRSPLVLRLHRVSRHRLHTLDSGSSPLRSHTSTPGTRARSLIPEQRKRIFACGRVHSTRREPLINISPPVASSLRIRSSPPPLPPLPQRISRRPYTRIPTAKPRRRRVRARLILRAMNARSPNGAPIHQAGSPTNVSPPVASSLRIRSLPPPPLSSRARLVPRLYTLGADAHRHRAATRRRRVRVHAP
ncbi:hypothetical protein B0H16DRAFT_52484 [Mycena metata]|uniref:Uncharacterized protein n=1 Tax=Mycena metata TaxID=1033252 RepID=A0AAD7N1Y0_9AGAR|nr:hypothetical protein B0H16DRAFT_52484 [Mycena metata]